MKFLQGFEDLVIIVLVTGRTRLARGHTRLNWRCDGVLAILDNSLDGRLFFYFLLFYVLGSKQLFGNGSAGTKRKHNSLGEGGCRDAPLCTKLPAHGCGTHPGVTSSHRCGLVIKFPNGFKSQQIVALRKRYEQPRMLTAMDARITSMASYLPTTPDWVKPCPAGLSLRCDSLSVLLKTPILSSMSNGGVISRLE